MMQKGFIYLDNAATSFPKPKSVIKAVNECMRKYCANPSRSTHKLAMLAAEKVYLTREALAEFLNFDSPEQIVFTLNATYALNIAIKTSLAPQSHCLISDLEHNSVLRPINKLAKQGIVSYSVFDTDGDIKSNIKSKITADTKAIICTLTSNVTGKRIPLEILSELKREYGLKLIVDASQEIGHRKIDLKKTPVDVLCAPAHKALFGISGLGFAVFCDKKTRESFVEGGSGFDSQNPDMPSLYPEIFEAGTLPLPAICALYEGIKFLNSYGVFEVEQKIKALSDTVYDTLCEVGCNPIYCGDGGIVSFGMGNIPSSIISSELNTSGIYIRSGLHCAPLVHNKLHTEKLGLARISLSVLNKPSLCDKLYLALKEIKSCYL